MENEKLIKLVQEYYPDWARSCSTDTPFTVFVARRVAEECRKEAAEWSAIEREHKSEGAQIMNQFASWITEKFGL